jgi:putative ABC transport system permease protein
MNTEYIDLNYVNLAFTLLMVAVAITFSIVEKLREETTILIATLRTAVQLLAVGFVLRYVFISHRWYVILGTLVLMNLFAGFDSARKIRNFKAFSVVTFSIMISASVTLSVLIFLVIQPSPWFEPAYVIALGGMILGNTMNACSLFLGHLKEDLIVRKAEVEGLLSLGATPRQASFASIKTALKQSITPVMNSMMVVGIVFLPGMMVGQLSVQGITPISAAKYQIMVMYMILGAVSISVWLLSYFSIRLFFNDRFQLDLPSE